MADVVTAVFSESIPALVVPIYFSLLAVVVLSCILFLIEEGVPSYFCSNVTSVADDTAHHVGITMHTEAKRHGLTTRIHTEDHLHCVPGTHELAFYTLHDGQQVDQPFIYSIPEAFFFMIATFTCIGFGEIPRGKHLITCALPYNPPYNPPYK
jgi:hypothetical protein